MTAGRHVFVPKASGHVLAIDYGFDHGVSDQCPMPLFHGPRLPPEWGAHPFFPGTVIYVGAEYLGR